VRNAIFRCSLRRGGCRGGSPFTGRHGFTRS
jgi:hypothetical protein